VNCRCSLRQRPETRDYGFSQFDRGGELGWYDNLQPCMQIAAAREQAKGEQAPCERALQVSLIAASCIPYDNECGLRSMCGTSCRETDAAWVAELGLDLRTWLDRKPHRESGALVLFALDLDAAAMHIDYHLGEV
jgi:hypothetical protein